MPQSANSTDRRPAIMPEILQHRREAWWRSARCQEVGGCNPHVVITKVHGPRSVGYLIPGLFRRLLDFLATDVQMSEAFGLPRCHRSPSSATSRAIWPRKGHRTWRIKYVAREVQSLSTSTVLRVMDVLLVNSPLFDAGSSVGAYADPPPIGLGYIGTALRERGYTVCLLDAVAEGLSVEAVCRSIEEARPTCVGVNVFSTNLHLVEKIIARSHVTQILVGGPAAKHLVVPVLDWDSPSAITLVTGDAEHAVSDLVEGRVFGEPWRGSPNRRLLTIGPGSPWFPASVDLPLDRTFFRHEPIREERWGVWEAHIITSRGCGHDCAFCSAARSANPGQQIRHRSEDHMAGELDDIRALHPQVDCIRVLDDLFLRNPTVIKRAARLFATRRLKWRAMAHIAGLAHAPTDVFQLLASSGCLELFVGVESGSPDRRRLIGKPSDPAPTSRVVKGLLDAGVGVKAYFVLGLPGETEVEMEATYAFAAQLAEYSIHAPGQFRVSAFKFRPYHGTRLYDELVTSGRVPNPIFEDRELAAQSGRRSYDFASNNFSAVPTDRLNQLIADVLGLNR